MTSLSLAARNPQWPRLALARTFYREPQVLILDEPAASLDSDAESRIFGRLEGSRNSRTTILISHDYSAVGRADTIVVLDRGRISEQGTHDQPMASEGIYAGLYLRQARAFD